MNDLKTISKHLVSNLKDFHQTLAKIFDCKEAPDIFLMLGSCGHDFLEHGKILNEFNIDAEKNKYPIFSERLPEFNREGHSRKLVLMDCDGVKVLVQTGKLHYFEGCSMDQIVFSVRAMASWGTKYFFVTSMAHSLSENNTEDDDKEKLKNKVAIIKDHINMVYESPLRGIDLKILNENYYHPNDVYSLSFRNALFEKLSNQRVDSFIYRFVPDFSVGTDAEIDEWMREKTICDQVYGYSVVPEAIAANQMGMTVFAVAEFNLGISSGKRKTDKTAMLLKKAVEVVLDQKNKLQENIAKEEVENLKV